MPFSTLKIILQFLCKVRQFVPCFLFFPAHHHNGFGRHEFEADMSAEEIFNMFFGGGFPSQTVYMRRGGGGMGGMHRGQRGAQQHRTFHHHQETREVR